MAEAEAAGEGPLSDEITMKLLTEVCEANKEKGFVVDGLPKSAAQAALLQDSCLEKLVVADVSEADLLEFHANRVMDPTDAKFYDKKNNPPPEGEVADRCIQRDDDKEEAVKERIAPWFKEIAGIKSAFGDKVFSVPGTTKSGGDEEAAMFAAVEKEVAK